MFLFITCPGRAGAEVYPYPAAPGLTASTDYQVRVDGKTIYGYTAEVDRIHDATGSDHPLTTATFASFDFSGAVTVAIKVNRTVRSITVRPLSAKIVPVRRGDVFVFTLSKPRNLMIEFDGIADIGRLKRPIAPEKPLFLFANPKDRPAPSRNDPGVLYFDQGLHKVKMMDVSRYKTVYLAPGAVVNGILYAQNVKGLTIRGRGVLNGEGIDKESYARGFALELYHCSDVTLDGITVRDSPHWTIVPTLCTNVQVNNIKILNKRSNGDGIDPCNCQHVRIRDCFLYTSDDCISPKGCVWWYKEAADYPLRDVLATNCFLASRTSAIKVGSETVASGVENLRFEDLDVYGSGSGFLVLVSDRATVNAIAFRNIRVERYAGYINMVSVYIDDAYSFDKGKPLGRVGAVTFENMDVQSIYGDGASQVSGQDAEHTVGRVMFRNVRLRGKALRSIDQNPGYIVPQTRPLPPFVDSILYE